MCLQRGHISQECLSNITYSNCRGRHHISICPNTLIDSTASEQKGMSNLDGTTHSQAQKPKPAINLTWSPRGSPASHQSGLNAEASASQSQNCRSTSLWVNTDRAVLLQMAQALVFNPHAPQNSCGVQIVLDCGSQRSYVTEQVVKELLLAPEGEQPLTIMTFGLSKEQSCVCESARLSLALRMDRKNNGCYSLFL